MCHLDFPYKYKYIKTRSVEKKHLLMNRQLFPYLIIILSLIISCDEFKTTIIVDDQDINTSNEDGYVSFLSFLLPPQYNRLQTFWPVNPPATKDLHPQDQYRNRKGEIDREIQGLCT